MQAGFSMLMIAPDERRVAKALLNSLNRGSLFLLLISISELILTTLQDVDKIPEISIELGILDKIKARVGLARRIDNAQHKAKKTNHDRKWMKETAEVLGVELDSDFARYARHCSVFEIPCVT
jgi:ATP-dependent RNA helicase DDX24/MAK5